MDKSLQELQGMLRIADGDIEKSSHVLIIQEGGRKIEKAKRKWLLSTKAKGSRFLIRTLPR
jgi:hypothetical protein